MAAAGGAFQLVLVSSDRNVEDFAKMLGAPRAAPGLPRLAATCVTPLTHRPLALCRLAVLRRAASLPGALAVPFTDSLKARETALTKQFQV